MASMSEWIQEHPTLAIGGGIIGVLLIAGVFMSKTMQPAPGAGTTTADLSGLKNGLVYVPTQTTFSTYNKDSNNITTTTTNNRYPPVPEPPPPPTQKSIIWDQHTTLGNQNLVQLASSLTRQLRAQGMPGSMSVTWHDLYAHNAVIMDAEMKKKHEKKKGDEGKNDVEDETFPGETISLVTPRWG